MDDWVKKTNELLFHFIGKKYQFSYQINSIKPNNIPVNTVIPHWINLYIRLQA